MKITHLELSEANKLVETLHRHHKPVIGHRFSIGAIHNNKLVGAAIVGRPVARKTDYKKVIEITRLVTDGTKNACSFLYGASARAGKELGYEKIQTFILESESGTSLIAAGWTKDENISKGGNGWQSRNGRRTDQPTENKIKYYKIL